MIFKDQALQNTFDHDGAMVVPFLTEVELEQLRLLYLQVMDHTVSGLYPSHSHGSLEQNLNVHHQLSVAIKQAADRLFTDYDFVANHFMVKGKRTPDEFRLHQDWNIVEEDKYDAVHIWCPLQSTSKDNGGMFVVKGSHLFFNNLRSGSLGIPFIDTTGKIQQNLSAFNMKAGEALLYKQATFHGSFANVSDKDRAVALCTIKQQSAPIVYYQKSVAFNENSEVDVYHISTGLLLGQLSGLEKGIPPTGVTPARKLKYTVTENSMMDALLFEKHLPPTTKEELQRQD